MFFFDYIFLFIGSSQANGVLTIPAMRHDYSGQFVCTITLDNGFSQQAMCLINIADNSPGTYTSVGNNCLKININVDRFQCYMYRKYNDAYATFNIC